MKTTTRNPLQRRCRWALAAALALLAPSVALAQSSPYYAGGSISYASESNLLRLADRQTAPEGYSKSDRITSTALLAGVDQTVGRQRVYGSLALRDNRFANNSVYDNQSYTLAAALDWATIERLTGKLAVSASRNLRSFNLQEIGLLVQKNLETTQTLDGALRWGFSARHALEASAGQTRVKNSLDNARVQARNYVQDTAALGLRWHPSSASSFGLALRSTEGRYPKFSLDSSGNHVADRFERRDLDFSAMWLPSGASRLDLRLRSGKTEYELATQRNFSGLTGSLAWTWVPTGKLRLLSSLSRETGQDSYAVDTFFGEPGVTDYSRVNTVLRLKADYELSAKVALTTRLSLAKRDLVRTQPGFFGPVEQTGRDRVNIFGVGARWAAHRSVSVGCDLGRESRSGRGQLGSDLSSSSASCFAQFLLQ